MPDERQLISQMARSRYWRWMRAYLLDRREALFREPAASDGQLWANRGAIEEVTRLLGAPELVMAWYDKARQVAEEAEKNVVPPDWVIGDADA